MKAPHERHRWSTSSPLAAPSKKGALSSSGTGTGRSDRTAATASASGGMLAQDRRRVVVEDAAVAAREHDVVLLDLALAGLAAGLDHCLREWSEAPHVVRRELPAAGVGGERAAGAELAVLDERSALALLAEAVVLEGDEDGVRVAVVQLEDVDVVAGHPRERERLLAGALRARVDSWIAAAPLVVTRGRLRGRPDVHGGLPEVPCTLCRGHDHGDRAVGYEAAVEEVERVDDHPRGLVVLERHRLSHLRARVHLGPLPLRDGDRAELL